ncbi:MAG: hypothetical protein Ct9H300mP28_07380 [Pseudomonadota bacterium]|nr:MAG: hypothetical protein Ct9H300mP28_07380 [Pseudomonadota bacterium]
MSMPAARPELLKAMETRITWNFIFRGHSNSELDTFASGKSLPNVMHPEKKRSKLILKSVLNKILGFKRALHQIFLQSFWISCCPRFFKVFLFQFFSFLCNLIKIMTKFPNSCR